MKSVTPLLSFTGYPSGEKTHFESGVSAYVPDDYASVLEAKGLIKKPKPRKPDPDKEE